MVEGFAILLFTELVAECARALFALPIPGPVIGMFMLAIAIVVRRRIAGVSPCGSSIERAANALITHMGLLFVPAGVGIVAVAPSLRGQWVALGVALLASTLITLAVTGGIMHLLSPRAKSDPLERAIPLKVSSHD